MEKVLENILHLKENNQKAIAILIDPDNLSRELLIQQVELAKINSVDFFQFSSKIADFLVCFQYK